MKLNPNPNATKVLRHASVWLWMLAAFAGVALLPAPSVRAATGKIAKEDKEAKEKKVPDTSYRVKVEVREVRNRRVEGTVRNHKIYVDQPKEFGADDSAPTPPETLAFALGACMVSTGRLVALQRKLPVPSIRAVVEGELDFARALGMGSKMRVGYSGLRLQVTIEGALSTDEKKKLMDEVASRCPMCDNLTTPTPITYELKE